MPNIDIIKYQLFHNYIFDFTTLPQVDFPTGRTYTGAKIKELALKLASALNKRGYKKGDVVLIFSTNCPEYVIILLACGVLGVAVSTANPAYTSSNQFFVFTYGLNFSILIIV